MMTLSERYKLNSEIGRGGDRIIDAVVIKKVLSLPSNEEQVERQRLPRPPVRPIEEERTETNSRKRRNNVPIFEEEEEPEPTKKKYTLEKIC